MWIGSPNLRIKLIYEQNLLFLSSAILLFLSRIQSFCVPAADVPLSSDCVSFWERQRAPMERQWTVEIHRRDADDKRKMKRRKRSDIFSLIYWFKRFKGALIRFWINPKNNSKNKDHLPRKTWPNLYYLDN